MCCRVISHLCSFERRISREKEKRQQQGRRERENERSRWWQKAQTRRQVLRQKKGNRKDGGCRLAGTESRNEAEGRRKRRTRWWDQARSITEVGWSNKDSKQLALEKESKGRISEQLKTTISNNYGDRRWEVGQRKIWSWLLLRQDQQWGVWFLTIDSWRVLKIHQALSVVPQPSVCS